MPSDSELVSRARDGDRAAFDEIVRRHGAMVTAIARGFAAIPEDADDLAQQAFVTAFARLDQLTDPDRLAGWLAAIARNEGRMWLRHRLSQPVLSSLEDDDVCAPADDTDGDGVRETVTEALRNLSDRHRRVVCAYYLDGHDYRETARLLDVPVSTVRGRLDRARHALRKELQEMVASHGSLWKLNTRDLAALRAAAECACSDPERGAINSLFFDGEGRIVSTDTHRLFVYTSRSLSGFPRSLVHADMARALRDHHPDARHGSLVLDGGNAALHLDCGEMLDGPLVEGDYPSWERVVPGEDWSVVCSAPAGHWLQALEVLRKHRNGSCPDPSAPRILVVVSPEEGRVSLREGQSDPPAQELSRELSVWFPARFERGEQDLIIAANAVYVEQAVRGLCVPEKRAVEFCARGSHNPFMHRPAGRGGVFVVTMPMQRPAPAADASPASPAGPPS